MTSDAFVLCMESVTAVSSSDPKVSGRVLIFNPSGSMGTAQLCRCLDDRDRTSSPPSSPGFGVHWPDIR